METFDCVSPLDYRYYGENDRIYKKVHPYLSEEANIRYTLRVEAALTFGLARRKLIPTTIAEEIQDASQLVTPKEVYEEERRIHHYTRAMVNCLRKKVSKNTAPFVHLFATSFDINDTATALRLKDFTKNVILIDLLQLEKILVSFARNTAEVVQIGRTHGQHAVPITFGFAIAEYIDRLGTRIARIQKESGELRGKLSGAVGAYNSFSLIIPDPEDFEQEVLEDLGLRPGLHSTQIVEPEYITDLIYAVISCFGVLANLADDMRHLQRTEIDEIRESFENEQVGSSTMPHKRNPWNFEHVKSLWKEFMPRMISVFSNQISEHQRDLTNSASSRFVPEILVGFTDAVDRLISICSKFQINKQNIDKNLHMSSQRFVAEPLYILLSWFRHPDANEKVRTLTLKAEKEGIDLIDCALHEDSLKPYFSQMSEDQINLLKAPTRYIGKAVSKTYEICDFWESFLLL